MPPFKAHVYNLWKWILLGGSFCSHQSREVTASPRAVLSTQPAVLSRYQLGEEQRTFRMMDTCGHHSCLRSSSEGSPFWSCVCLITLRFLTWISLALSLLPPYTWKCKLQVEFACLSVSYRSLSICNLLSLLLLLAILIILQLWRLHLLELSQIKSLLGPGLSASCDHTQLPSQALAPAWPASEGSGLVALLLQPLCPHLQRTEDST